MWHDRQAIETLAGKIRSSSNIKWQYDCFSIEFSCVNLFHSETVRAKNSVFRSNSLCCFRCVSRQVAKQGWSLQCPNQGDLFRQIIPDVAREIERGHDPCYKLRKRWIFFVSPTACGRFRGN
jgi:hypothetical protein